MSDIEFSLIISMNVFWVFNLIDHYWFETERLTKRLMALAKKEGCCPICNSCVQVEMRKPL